MRKTGLSKVLTELRTDRGWSPEDVERRSRGKLAASRIRLMEAGTLQELSIADARALAAVYEITPADLLVAAKILQPHDLKRTRTRLLAA